jgi:murein L,D-transpeptidase YafK
VVLAGAAAFFVGDWLMLTPQSADERAIAYERSERRIRASLGLSLPDTPDLNNLSGRLAAHGLIQGAPVLIRIFKREFELELWMKRHGVFHRFTTYPVCRWSGRLGPKIKQGDRQTPEGFYAVTREALNPNSRWYRSFNIGFPNAYDRAHGRTGTFLMVHGGCASVGCFAMTNAQMDEIWRLITAAFDAGQTSFQVQSFPFRMSQEKLGQYQGHSDEAFWHDLKAGNDLFEATLLPPTVHLCRGRYAFAKGGDGPPAGPEMTGRCPDASAKN